MIPEPILGQLAVLNTHHGDLKISFDSDNPEDVQRAREAVTDMLRRGYLIFVTTADGRTKRVRRFDSKHDEYIIGQKEEERVPAKKAKNATAVPRTAGG